MAGTRLFVGLFLVMCATVMFFLPAYPQDLQQQSERAKSRQHPDQKQKTSSQNLQQGQKKPSQQDKSLLSGQRQHKEKREASAQTPKGEKPAKSHLAESSRQGISRSPDSPSRRSTGGQAKGGSSLASGAKEKPASPKTGKSSRLYYQQVPSSNQAGSGNQRTSATGSGAGQTQGAKPPKPDSSGTASGQAGSSQGQSSAPKPPSNSAEAYSRLKAAKEALEYYTSGNGRFVKDRDAQIEKLRREIGFLETYEKNRDKSSATSSQVKSPPKSTATSAGPSSSGSAKAVSPDSGSSSTPKTTRDFSGSRPGGSASKPSGYVNVYDDRGNKVGRKPYWGSGTKADPYRDYQDVKKPFGDSVWGSGSRQDPYTNVVKPPSGMDQSQRSSIATMPQAPGGSSGLESGDRDRSGKTPPPQKPETKTSGAIDPKGEKPDRIKEATGQLESLEKDFSTQVAQLENAIDSFFDKTKAEFERTIESYEEGGQIIFNKIRRVEDRLKKAEERGDQSAVRDLERDWWTLVNQMSLIAKAQSDLQSWLEKESNFREEAKDNLRLTHENFKMENESMLKELSANPPQDLDKRLKDHLSKWNPKKLENMFQYEPSWPQSPLVTPKIYDPSTEKSKAEKDKWRQERKDQIEKEYEDKIQDVANQNLGQGFEAVGSSVGKHPRIEELRKEKEARQRQIDVMYRESLIKSGRLSQDEYNALNTPKWEEDLEKYREDIRKGRIAGEWPTP